jgi:hypothetical protein
VAISNFPLSFGDTIGGLICLLSPTEASFSMINMATVVHVGFGQIPLTAPPGTASMENQAERSTSTRLRRPWPGLSRGGGAADTVLNMVENGATVATTTIETPTLIKIDYTGAPPAAKVG